MPFLALLGKLPLWVWVLVGVAVWGGYGHYQLNTLRAEVAEANRAANTAQIRQLERDREEDQRRVEEQAAIVEQEKRGAAAKAAAQATARSAVVASRLQQRIDTLVASASTCNTATPDGGTAAGALGELFGNCVARYRSLGEEAAACRTAGLICQRAYDALRDQKK